MHFALCIIIELLYILLATRKGIGKMYHGRFMPVGGGVIFIFSALLPLVAGQCGAPMVSIFGAALTLALLSFADDLLGLPAMFRLIIQSLVVAVVMFGLCLDGHYIAFAFACIFCVGYTNTSNFIDGINGMLPAATAVVAAGVLAAPLAGIALPQGIVLLALGTFLAAIVLGLFNFRRTPLVFAGDTGSITAGFLCSTCMVALCLQLHSLTPVMLAAVYITDTFSTFLLRLARRQNVLQGHKEHLYQQLEAAGMPQLQISAAYAATQLAVSLVWISNPQSDILALATVLALITLRICLPKALKKKAV